MALYARLNEALNAVVEEREIDAALVSRMIADGNPKAAYWRPLTIAPQPTLTATQVVSGSSYVIGQSSVTKTWTVRELTNDEKDAKFIRDNAPAIRQMITNLKAGAESGTSAERLVRVETGLSYVLQWMLRSALALVFLLPMAGSGALDFTAASSHGVANTGALPTNSFTLYARTYQTSYTTRVIICTYGPGSSDHRALIYWTTSNRIIAHVIAGSTSAIIITDAGLLNKWIDVAIVRNGGSDYKFYIDGVERGSSASTVAVNPQDRIIISAQISAGSYASYGIGRHADPAMWSVALTTAELESLAAGASPNEIRPQSLVFYAPLTNIGPGGGSGSSVNTVGPPVLLTNTVTQATTQPRIYR
jgi:hypothetical protein